MTKRSVQRRNSSIGYQMMMQQQPPNAGEHDPQTLAAPVSAPLIQDEDNDVEDFELAPHFAFSSGGSAAAYEAARYDYYLEKRRSEVAAGKTPSPPPTPQRIRAKVPDPNDRGAFEKIQQHHKELLDKLQETKLKMNEWQQQKQDLQTPQQASTTTPSVPVTPDRPPRAEARPKSKPHFPLPSQPAKGARKYFSEHELQPDSKRQRTQDLVGSHFARQA